MSEAIQIIGLRPFYNQTKKDLDIREKRFSVTAKTTASLFENIDKILSSVPEEEHYNLFWSAGYCKADSRNIERQDTVTFDIDDIEDGRDEKYVDVLCRALNIDADKCPIIFTGNGIQIVIGLKSEMLGKDIDKNKPNYKKLCSKIDKALKDNGLAGHADPVVLSQARLLRMPKTKNIKPMKYASEELNKTYLKDYPEVKIKEAKLYTNKLNGTGFDLDAVELEFESEIEQEKISAVYPIVDVKSVMEGCDFIKHCQAEPNKVSEAEWYALLGITSFFGDNNEQSHKLSEKYSGYNRGETEAKAIQARNAVTGPRTCKSVGDMWSGCAECKNKDKHVSPIQIKSPDFIGTEATGFTSISEKGRVTYYYHDLMKFMDRTLFHKTCKTTKTIYVFNGKFWEEMSETSIKHYAEKMFAPKPMEYHANEFLNTLRRNNIVGDEFTDQVNPGYLNLNNGVVEISTGNLLPHSKDFSFKYVLPYDYDPTQTCPTWDRMMKNIMLDRQHLIDVIEEFVGYCVSGSRYDIQKILIFSGDGYNGKSTVCSAIQNVLGADNYSAVNVSEIDKNRFLAAKLYNKFANFSEEEPMDCFKATGQLKKLVGNSVVYAEEKNKSGFFFINRAKIIMSYNEVPLLPDSSKGMKRRMIIIPFDLDISEHPEARVHNIDKKLFMERAGILNKAIEALKRLNARGDFQTLEESEKTIYEMELDSDPVKDWMDKYVVITRDEQDKYTAGEAYQKFRKDIYAEDQKYMVIMQRTFVKRLRKILSKKSGCGYKTCRVGKETPFCFYGIKIDCDAEKIGQKENF